MGELTDAQSKLGDIDTMALLARELLEQATTCKPDNAYVLAAGMAVYNLVLAGQMEVAVQLIAAADEVLQRIEAQDPRAVGALAHGRAVYLRYVGDLVGEIALDEQAAAAFERAGDERNACRARAAVADAYAYLGLYAEAEAIEREDGA